MSELMQKKIELDPTGKFVTLVLPAEEVRFIQEALTRFPLKSLSDTGLEIRNALLYDLEHTLPLK